MTCPGVTERVSGRHQDVSTESHSESQCVTAPASPAHSLGAGQPGPASSVLSLPGCTRGAKGPDGSWLPAGRRHLAGEPARVAKDAPALGLRTAAPHPHARPLSPALPRALTIAAAASPLQLFCPSGRSARGPGGSGGRGGACPERAGGAPPLSGNGDRVKSKAAGYGSRDPGTAPLAGLAAPGLGGFPCIVKWGLHLISLVSDLHLRSPVYEMVRVEWARERGLNGSSLELHPNQAEEFTWSSPGQASFVHSTGARRSAIVPRCARGLEMQRRARPVSLPP